MAASTKIQNNLFVWGNVTGQASDLANISVDGDTKTAEGEKSGNLLYATIYNSLGRNASLIPFSLIEAFRYGPYGQQSGESYDNSTEDYNDAWDQGLSSIEINYDVQTSDILTTFVPNLRAILNQYIKYAQSYRSIQANVWTNPRKFTIADDGGHNYGSSTIINGGTTNYDPTNGYVIHLPSTINADLNGLASNVNTGQANTTELLLTGVASNATTTLKRNSLAKINGSILKLGSDSSHVGEVQIIGGQNIGSLCYLEGNTNHGIGLNYGAESISIGSSGFAVDHGTDCIFYVKNESTTISSVSFITIGNNPTGQGPTYGFRSGRVWSFTNDIYVHDQINFSGATSLGQTWYINSQGSGKLSALQLGQLGAYDNRVQTCYLASVTFGSSGSTYGVNNSGEATFAKVLSTSDKRLKKNIKSFEAHKSILDLDVVEFDYKDSGKHSIGCIAQELQEICPEIVHENEEGYLTIEENKISYLVLQEVKALRKEIEELKGK